ncbi:hypothetical protein Nepgr_010304 [Nepenthes gracilis]|uniref:Uncharacterized protein n=1 Tax=Nepenthes gracilis TaxID=150966 RepID=A0AAD3SD39_NEPGR|nr:hypothetical protein Nepgr_010304 [Nepenthes gracilis]
MDEGWFIYIYRPCATGNPARWPAVLRLTREFSAWLNREGVQIILLRNEAKEKKNQNNGSSSQLDSKDSSIADVGGPNWERKITSTCQKIPGLAALAGHLKDKCYTQLCQQLLSFLVLQLDNKQVAAAVNNMTPGSVSQAHTIQTPLSPESASMSFSGIAHMEDDWIGDA